MRASYIGTRIVTLRGRSPLLLDENGDDTGLTVTGRIDRKQLTAGFAHDAGDGCAAIARRQNVMALQISLGRRETGKPGCKRRDDER